MIMILRNLAKLFVRQPYRIKYTTTIAQIGTTQTTTQKPNKINFSNPRANILLTEHQQQALTAYFAFLYIVNFKPDDYIQDSRSIQQRLIDKSTFDDFIIGQTRKYYQIEKVSQLGLQEANINEVMCGFNLILGGIFQEKIRRSAKIQIWDYCQNCELDESQIRRNYGGTNTQYNSSRILFFPTLLTGQIFRKMLEGGNLLISSGEQSGKSYAFLLYDYLSKFIVDCRMSQAKNLNAQPFSSLLKDSYFYKVRKMLYVQSMNSGINYFSLFRYWFAHYHPKQSNQANIHIENMDQTYQDRATEYKFKQDIIEIVQVYRKKGLQSTIVFDQFHYYYQNLIKRINIGSIGKSNQQQIQNLFRSKATQAILNCQTQLIIVSYDYKIPTLIQKQADKFGQINLYGHQKHQVQNLIIDRPKMSFQQSGQIENYAFLWFQLEKILIQNNIILQQRNRLRRIFEQVFCLPNSEGNKQNKKLVQWNRYTNFLKFYYMDDLDLAEQILQKQSAQIKQIFLDLKQKCQKHEQSFCSKELSTFLRQHASQLDQKIRSSILIYIEQKAIQIIDKGIIQQLERNYFQISLQQIGAYLQISNQDVNQLKEHINIVAQQCPIGFYDKEVMLMTVFYRPKDFIEELKTIIGDFKDKYYQQKISSYKVIKQLIRQRVQKKRKYLKDFIKSIFKCESLLNLNLSILHNNKKMQSKAQFNSKHSKQNKQEYINIKNILAAAKDTYNQDQYASLVPQADDKCHFDALIIRKIKRGCGYEINTFSWYVDQLHGKILVDSSSYSDQNKNNLTSLQEIDQIKGKVFGAISQVIIPSRQFKKHQFYLFIKMMLQSTQHEGISWRHIIILPKSNELLQKYSKDDKDRIWQGDKLLFEGSPQWSQNGKLMKFSCDFAYMETFQEATRIYHRDVFQVYKFNQKFNENVEIENFYKINPSWFLQTNKY